MRPDGRVFQHCNLSVATNPQAQPSAAALPHGSAAGAYGLGAAPLMALTQDAKFLATLKKVSESTHPVRVAGSEIDFSAALMSQHAGVAVLDSAAVATAIEKLTTRLHAQFPDLVLIVAGTADEQGLLAAQITDGSVHRFLHKPVSEQRVRLFVEAAWRRHEEGVQDARSAPPPTRPRRAQWGLIAAAMLAVAAPLTWLALRSSSTPAPATGSAAAVGDDAALEDLLTRADKALAAEHLLAPPEANAAALYREAVHRNARDPRAVSGLDDARVRLDREDPQVRIGEREGWRTRYFGRGAPGQPPAFHVIEFWLENRVMVEVATPDMVEEYTRMIRYDALEAHFGSRVAA